MGIIRRKIGEEEIPTAVPTYRGMCAADESEAQPGKPSQGKLSYFFPDAEPDDDDLSGDGTDVLCIP
jgi:hypothetical protein